MRRLWSLIFLLSSVVCLAQSRVNVGGTLTDPQTGQLFNGYLKISLLKSVKNTCGTVYQVVPTFSNVYPVKNGVAIGLNTASYIAQTCMSPRIPYYIEMDDVNHSFLYFDNWYFPLTTAGTVDMGQMQQVGFGGPIVLSVPNAIVGTPLGNQTITQPGATALIVNNLVVTGTFSGATVAAATVAGRLASPPIACGSGLFAYGIDEFGNSLCRGVSTGALQYLQIAGGGTINLTTQGEYIFWNVTGGGGETDFINQKGAGAGGWNFYNATSSLLGPAVVHIDGAGNVTANSFIGSVSHAVQADHSSNTLGFATNPLGCPNGQAVNTVGFNGSPSVCVPVTPAATSAATFFTVGNVCPSGMSGTGAGSFCGGSVTYTALSLPAMTNFNYNLICGYDTSNFGGNQILASVVTYGKTANGFSYWVVLNRANSAVPTNSQIGFLECERHQY